MTKKRIVVLISGSGSNLQAIIDACGQDHFPAQVVGVISNKEGVKGLQRATQAGINTRVLQHQNYPDRASFDQALRAEIDSFEPDLVVLAGFMRILTAEFVNHYLGRLLNIHPSLLPKYPGLHTHRRALDAGEFQHGTTVHFVTAELDGGPAIIHAVVAITADDTETSLAQKVLVLEHQIYPRAVRWFAEDRLRLHEGKSWLDGAALGAGGIAHN